MVSAPRSKVYWALALAQSNRLLRVGFPSVPELDAAFVVAAWRGREALSEGFEHSLDLLTEDAGRPLKSLVGQPVCLEVETNTVGNNLIVGAYQAFRFFEPVLVVGTADDTKAYAVLIKPAADQTGPMPPAKGRLATAQREFNRLWWGVRKDGRAEF